METIDFGKALKHLYTAKRRIEEVEAKTGTFFVVEGQGKPGGDAFHEALGWLFATTYTAKFMLKFEGAVDFKVSKLECLYLSAPDKTPMAEWRWRFLLRVPDTVTAGHLAKVRKTLKERKGLDTKAVKRIRWKEGRALQVLHVGPYDEVGPIYCQLEAHAREHGLAVQCPAHEIYLNDPRRVAPEKIRTIVRLPVKKA
jgi:hypothetical protein